MDVSSWQRFVIGSTTYMIRRESKSHSHKVILTDFKYVWVQEATEDYLISSCRRLNPLLEGEGGVLVEKAFALLDRHIAMSISADHQEQGNELSVAHEQDLLVLKLKAKLEGELSFKFELHLLRQSAETFFSEVTLSILSVTEELVARQETLCDLLQKKDVEISEYRMEGARISRNNIETPEFSKHDFLLQCHGSEQACTISEEAVEVLGIVQRSMFNSAAAKLTTKTEPKSGESSDTETNVKLPGQFTHVSVLKTKLEEDTKPKKKTVKKIKLTL